MDLSSRSGTAVDFRKKPDRLSVTCAEVFSDDPAWHTRSYLRGPGKKGKVLDTSGPGKSITGKFYFRKQNLPFEGLGLKATLLAR
jgi:hypothetical protein